MDYDRPFEFIFGYVDKSEFVKYFRLVITVCGYLLVRTLYMNYAGKKHVERQIAQDEKDKKEEPERKAREAEELQQKLQDEAKTFGWGKKTRAQNKHRQEALEQEMDILRSRNQSAYDAAEDHDIDYLLED